MKTVSPWLWLSLVLNLVIFLMVVTKTIPGRVLGIEFGAFGLAVVAFTAGRLSVLEKKK